MKDDQKLMLFFECGDEQYAVACSDVVEVIPQIHTEEIIEYHGSAVPVVDFTAMQTGEHSASVLSTRIILLNTGNASMTGLTAERVLHTESFPESAFIDSGSTQGICCQQIATEGTHVSVITPACILDAIKKRPAKGSKK
jgi:chemotaxis signal transduction protein